MTNPSESPSLAGVRVAVFEARMAGTVADMIARHGGIVLAAPALWEIPLGEGPEVTAFAETLTAGGFDVVIFETGAGVRYLAQAIETRISRQTWIAALEKTRVVARGPKPTAALPSWGCARTFKFLRPIPGARRLVCSTSNCRLRACGLRCRNTGLRTASWSRAWSCAGATVTQVRVYRWALPEDLEPLRAAIAEIAMGRVGIALFTSSQQVEHLVSVAALEGREAEIRAAMAKHTVMGSIGPTTSETLRLRGLPVDIEPAHPKLGHLIAAIVAGCARWVKRRSTEYPGPGIPPIGWLRPRRAWKITVPTRSVGTRNYQRFAQSASASDAPRRSIPLDALRLRALLVPTLRVGASLLTLCVSAPSLFRRSASEHPS